MHVDLFDRYKTGQSLLHQLNPQVKVVVTLLFILSNILLPDGAWRSFLLAWGLILLISHLSGLGIGYTLKRSFVAIPFALAAFTAIFALPGQTVAVWDFGPWRLVATDAGLLRFFSVVVRSWLSVQVAILLVATTRFPDLMHALRHLRMPGLLVSVISFMYRYLFVLVDEAMRLMRAREARSASLPGNRSGGSLVWRARIAGNMAGQLFLRSYERSERIYNAMLSRGFQGQLLTIHTHDMRVSDWMLASWMVIVLLFIQVIARL